MRDRRNTHLSNVSTSSSSSSSSSTDSCASTSTRTSVGEKDLEYQSEVTSYDDDRKPRHIKTKPLLFYIIATTIFLSLFIIVTLWLQLPLTSLAWTKANSSHHEPDALGGYAFVDDAGRQRWSIYIPPSQALPPSTSDYQRICHDVKHLRSTKWPLQRMWRSSHLDISYDSTFMDVDEAQKSSALPPALAASADICQKSLTFVMDSDASFGKTLLLLWLSYGFAKRDGRAFFLDDSRWAYGRFDTYFPPLPRPGCAPPPISQVVPCPLQAKHLVVTSATGGSTFDWQHGGLSHRQVSLRGSRQGTVYDLIRIGYEATFRLIGDDTAYVQQRVAYLREQAVQHRHPLIGMHIRRGDLRPFELQFSQDYLPLEKFTDAAKRMLGSGYDPPGALVLASDDPDIIDSAELRLAASPDRLHKSQERIQLATKLALDRTSPAEPIRYPGSAYVKHIDENAGWDGGFYTALFNSLGDSRPREQKLLRPHPEQEKISRETLRMRELIGRGYLLDLAVLSQMDGVVCAVSSAACRILGVMLGRDAMRSGKWINVDDNRAWSWDGSNEL